MEEKKDMNFEEAFADLESIIKKLEEDRDSMTIEEIAGYYAYGVDLMKMCEDNLDQVEKSLDIVDEKGEADGLS